LFLDDDILPEPQIINDYWELIQKHPNAAGYIGRTVRPPPQTPRQFAISFSGIAIFWDISAKTKRDLPWGITANLCVKRSPDVLFHHEVFTKGGGGEDVDFCLRLDQWYRERSKDARSFIPAPKAMVQHPYWNNGLCFLHHFFAWSKGDSMLMEVYPKKSFWSFPDFSETAAFLLLSVVALLVMDSISIVTALVTLLSFAFGEILYETICHLDLVEIWGVPFTFKVGFTTTLVRTISEIGRFYGQFERGTVHSSLFHRYNWFEENWPEWPLVERMRSFKRGLFRASVVMLSLWFTNPIR
jgi:hypothetical protein